MALPDTISNETANAAFTIDLEKAFPGEEELNRLIAEAYFEAASRTGSNMPLVTEMLEQIRGNFFQYRFKPFKAWYRIKIDRNRFDKDPLVALLMQLKDRYYTALCSHIATLLQAEFSADPTTGFHYWLFFYEDALLNWEEEVIKRLFKQELPFSPPQQEKVQQYRRFSHYLESYRAAESFPFYLELADSPGISPYFKSLLLTEAARSLLYGQRVRESKQYFDKALGIEETVEVIRGLGEYHLYWNQYEEARAKFQESADKDASDNVNFIFMGDVFKRESKFEEAEQWYKETISANFLSVAGYQRLIELYGLWEKNPEKKAEIPALVDQVKRIGTAFQGYELFDTYRIAGSACSVAGNYESSVMYYQLADAIFPDHTAAKLDLGYIYVYQKKFAKAEALFTALLSADDTYCEAYQGLGWLYEEQRRFEEAVTVYQRCLEHNPSRADALYNLIGRAYWLHANYSSAAEFFSKAIDKYGYEPVYYENLLDALTELNQKEEREKLLLKMIGLFEDAVNYPAYIDKLAVLYQQSGDLANAEKYLVKYAEVNPTYTSYDNLGNFFYDQNDAVKALFYYQKAIELKPDEAMLHEHLGMSYQMNSDMDAAETSYRHALELDATSGMYYNRLGLFYYNQSKFVEALTNFTKAREREANNTTFLFNIAMAYDMLGKPEDSLPIYEELLTNDEQKDLIRFRLGVNSLNRNEYEKALEWLEAVKTIYVENSYFMEIYGLTLEKLDKREEAIEWYNYVLTRYPDDDYFNNRIGMLYHSKGGAEDLAEKHYKKAIEKTPDFQIYRDNLSLLKSTPPQ